MDAKLSIDSNLAPVANRVEVDAARDQSGRQLAAPRFQRVRADGHRPINFTRVQECHDLHEGLQTWIR